MIKKLCMFIVSVLTVFTVLVVSSVEVFATQTNYDIQNEDLYNATNNYTYNPNYVKDEARYDLSNKDESFLVSEEEPLLTVFTHGLGGSASHWSNYKGGNFKFSEDSLITRLANLKDSKVYWVVFKNKTEFQIYDITEQVYSKSAEPYSKVNPIDDIVDISRHTIVIFEAYDIVGPESVTDGINDDVYTEFNYAISSIVYDLKVANNGILPRMNLIGHSRGGITNMQYALDHPDLVDSIYSFGTPYTGSTTASIDAIWFDGMFGGYDAEMDIISESVYGKYRTRWNNGYLPEDSTNDLYSHIEVMALAGYGTLLNLALGLTTDVSLSYLSSETDISEEVLNIAINTALAALNTAVIGQHLTPVGITSAVLRNLIIGGLSEVASHLDLSTTAIDDLAQIIANEITLDIHPPFVSWQNDGLVDLGSQLGYEGLVPLPGESYKGFKRITKAFTHNNTDFDNINTYMPAVIHNLEARDEELGTYVVDDISMGHSINYETYRISSTEVGIRSFIGESTASELIIPETIEGKDVVAIADYAFANNVYGKDHITSIVIPSSVREIGRNAFYNSESIESITFADESELTSINQNAFAMMPELSTFEIQEHVNFIDETAFENSHITSFSVDNNNNYLWQNNFLIDTNVIGNESIAIYANPEANSFYVPSSVKVLSASLFEYNRNIQTINLNQVEYVGHHAFTNSTLTTVTGGTKVKNAGENAFDYTPWLDNMNSEFTQIGTVLIDYQGNDVDVVIPEGITRIAENSFHNDVTETIVFPESLETIGDEAFTNATQLDWVLFKSTQPPVLDGTVVNHNVTMYVKSGVLVYYQNSIFFADISNPLTTRSVSITFKDIHGATLGTRNETYGSSFDQFINAPAITGMDFLYWEDQSGQIFHKYDYFDSYENLVLSPVYEESIYTINIFDGDNQDVYEINYGDLLDIQTPFKEGYIFRGWYDSQNGGNLVINTTGRVVWNRTNEVENLYAHYELLIYSINYEENGGTFVGSNEYTFTVEDPIALEDISELKWFGHVFDCWEYNNQEFTTTYGIYENITLEANWIGVVITMTMGVTTTIGGFSDGIVIIDLTNANRYQEYIFTISSTVKSVTFIGNGNSFINMRIIVASRSGKLVMGFESMKFHPARNTNGQGFNAINSTSHFDFYISYKNANSITGGDGEDGTNFYDTYNQATNNQDGDSGLIGGNGSDGGYGIVAYKVVFTEYDYSSDIDITGGDGGDGGHGGYGQQGSDGVNPPSGSFIKPVAGDDGANGGSGGDGGDGGDGGYAVRVSYSTALKVSPSGQYTFKGGNGGRGGRGGYGGAGGDGASDISTNIWNGVGDPGDGGDGGRGGNGGDGGDGSIATNASYVYGTGGSGGTAGVARRGGYGGDGGSAGNYGDDGDDGDDGNNGSYGSVGSSGRSGYNTTGTSAGTIHVNYVYNKAFMQLG